MAIVFTLLLILVYTYLVGSIPTGYWVGRYFFASDVTQHGSGNIGASNVARVYGKRYFTHIFLCDAGKAYLAMWSSLFFLPACIQCGSMTLYVPYLLTAALLAGNAYSPFLRFSGGKGVATTVGILWYVLWWPVSLAFMVTWMVVVSVRKEPFLASIVSFVVIWIANVYMNNAQHSFFILALFAWALFRHWKNVTAWLTVVKKI